MNRDNKGRFCKKTESKPCFLRDKKEFNFKYIIYDGNNNKDILDMLESGHCSEFAKKTIASMKERGKLHYSFDFKCVGYYHMKEMNTGSIYLYAPDDFHFIFNDK